MVSRQLKRHNASNMRITTYRGEDTLGRAVSKKNVVDMRGDNVSSTLSQSPAAVKREEKTELPSRSLCYFRRLLPHFQLKGSEGILTSISLIERGEAIIAEL